MDHGTGVSVIIPTYNRRVLVQRALHSVMAQSRRPEDVIVVDDGSTDGTGEALRAAFGDSIRYVWQPNAGVSSARNHGLRLARGDFIALLDSDDEWLPEKTALQRQWLEERPDFGMVLCDVARVDARGQEFEIFHRRELLPEDGNILKWVLLEPALVPASAMLRRTVIESIGGFSEALPTAEDLDFHLRIAARFKIGVLERKLVRAMRGHAGLSALDRTYDDYARVIECAVAASAGQIEPEDAARALARAYARSARGMLLLRRWSAAWAFARKAWRLEPDAAARARLLQLAPFALRRAIATVRAGAADPRTSP